jgi:hypothetical protein
LGYRELAQELLQLYKDSCLTKQFKIVFNFGNTVRVIGMPSVSEFKMESNFDEWNELASESQCVLLGVPDHATRAYPVTIDFRCLERFVARTVTIFYSWQSWLPVATNKDLIREALDSAVAVVNENEDIHFDIDSDLVGVAGAPSFATAILQKIANADIFIADVSAVGSEYSSEKTTNRPIPNANVMFEYGYASAKLSAERIILVHNNSYARVEELPSDIRQNKVLTYTCSSNDENTVALAKKELSEQFVKELTIIAKKLLAE